MAEGVETKLQVDFLMKADCYLVQGYYFAKPMSVEEFEKLLALRKKSGLSQDDVADKLGVKNTPF